MTDDFSANIAPVDDDLPPIETLSLPLDAWHRAKGARMVEFAGYHMPIQYEGIMAEHGWTRQNAGLYDVSHMGQLQLAGPDVASAIEALVPGDICALGVGRMRYSLLLNDDGGILDDLMITNAGDHLYLVVNGAVKADDIAHIRLELADDITLNYMEDQALLALQGPVAVDALDAIVPGVARLVFMTAAAFDWNGTPLWISRSGYTGEDGYEISVPADAAVALADALCADARVRPCGLGARDSLRLEAGLPLYGHDLDEGTSPVEGDLTFAISKRRRA
ncbi:MAG: glycine cleavage system aminomethyltransferase GcvT, partial [Sphingopyxis sp.]